MNPRMLNCCVSKSKTDTYESLRKEYDCIKSDIKAIENIEISEDAKKLPLEELNKLLNDIKERMHNYIDTL
jgi:hypothetical protein